MQYHPTELSGVEFMASHLRRWTSFWPFTNSIWQSLFFTCSQFSLLKAKNILLNSARKFFYFPDVQILVGVVWKEENYWKTRQQCPSTLNNHLYFNHSVLFFFSFWNQNFSVLTSRNSAFFVAIIIYTSFIFSNDSSKNLVLLFGIRYQLTPPPINYCQKSSFKTIPSQEIGNIFIISILKMKI